jgi:hypothetical protein
LFFVTFWNAQNNDGVGVDWWRGRDESKGYGALNNQQMHQVAMEYRGGAGHRGGGNDDDDKSNVETTMAMAMGTVTMTGNGNGDGDGD